MNKISILLILLLSVSQLRAQHAKSTGDFTLKGMVTGRKSGIIILTYTNKAKKYIEDTVTLKNGAFTFHGAINGPVSAQLWGVMKSRSLDDPNFTEIFLSPAVMSISLTEKDFKHHKMTGSSMEADMEGLRKQKAAILNAEYELGLQLKEIDSADTSTKTRAALAIKRDSAYNASQRYSEQERKINYAFVARHPASYLSPYLMINYTGSHRLPIDSALMFYNAFTPAVKNSVAGAEIGREINARQASAPGKIAPVFVKTDIDGKSIDLTSFRNKNYVLLDFWASWCIPCRAETPRIKQLYKRFHAGGLEIISIAWDFKEKDWRDAISKDSTGMWRHIKADMHMNDGTMREKYAINGIPSYILIDKKGMVIGRYHGNDDKESTDDLEKKLTEIIPSK